MSPFLWVPHSPFGGRGGNGGSGWASLAPRAWFGTTAAWHSFINQFSLRLQLCTRCTGALRPLGGDRDGECICAGLPSIRISSFLSSPPSPINHLATKRLSRIILRSNSHTGSISPSALRALYSHHTQSLHPRHLRWWWDACRWSFVVGERS